MLSVSKIYVKKLVCRIKVPRVTNETIQCLAHKLGGIIIHCVQHRSRSAFDSFQNYSRVYGFLSSHREFVLNALLRSYSLSLASANACKYIQAAYITSPGIVNGSLGAFE